MSATILTPPISSLVKVTLPLTLLSPTGLMMAWADVTLLGLSSSAASAISFDFPSCLILPMSEQEQLTNNSEKNIPVKVLIHIAFSPLDRFMHKKIEKLAFGLCQFFSLFVYTITIPEVCV